MAGDWIKMRIDLQSHPKIVRILSATESDKFRVIGGLHAVWAIFDTHSEDGILNGYTPKALDHVIGWDGFSSSMVDVGWLEETPEGLVIPGFQDHNGKSGKRRAEDQKRKRESRNCPQSVRKMSEKKSDELGTREEKRREDKSFKSPPTPQGGKLKADVVEFVLPDWVDRGAWDGFVAMRKKIKKPMTDKAMSLAVAKLESLAAQGHKPDAVLDQSTLNSWQGLFEVKNGSSQSHAGAGSQSRPSLSEQVRQRNAERQAERDREAGYGPQGAAELFDTELEGSGRDFEGEFSRVASTDGKIMGADDRFVRA